MAIAFVDTCTFVVISCRQAGFTPGTCRTHKVAGAAARPHWLVDPKRHQKDSTTSFSNSVSDMKLLRCALFDDMSLPTV